MIKQILKELHSHGIPDRIEKDRAYHKSKREHWGVPAVPSNLLAKALAQGHSEEELFSIARELWETDLFDPMMLAARILSLKKIKASQKLWEEIQTYLKSVDGWALEDTLAHAAWKCILNNELLLDDLELWTDHPNFWMRRAALVYTLPFANEGKSPERMLNWAAKYANDPEWFIQKAIGWWLRVLGEHNPERVLIFIEKHRKVLKSVAIKEATRKL